MVDVSEENEGLGKVEEENVGVGVGLLERCEV